MKVRPDCAKIISGGQTGADRAAMDWAMEHQVPHGGWCPKGRQAEHGRIPERYSLRETPSDDSAQRTEWNIRDSDGTVIFSIGPRLTGGSKQTAELARQHGKPMLHLCKNAKDSVPEQALIEFIVRNQIHSLNIAGPRASEEPDIATFVREVLDKTFGQ